VNASRLLGLLEEMEATHFANGDRLARSLASWLEQDRRAEAKCVRVTAIAQSSLSRIGGHTDALDQSAGLTRSIAKTDRAIEAWYHPSIA
jgi:hypothetical protein